MGCIERILILKALFQKPFQCTSGGFTTSEVVVSVALLSAFYASIITISSLSNSNSRSNEIRPALDQVITSDIENIRNSSWAYLYVKPTLLSTSCYLTDPSCPPNQNKSIEEMRSICSDINANFLRNLRLPPLSLSASTHSVFRDNSSLTLKRSIVYNISHPIPLRTYDRNSIRLDYYLQSSDPQLLDQLSDISSITNNNLLLRSYTFTPSAHSFCTGFSLY